MLRLRCRGSLNQSPAPQAPAPYRRRPEQAAADSRLGVFDGELCEFVKLCEQVGGGAYLLRVGGTPVAVTQMFIDSGTPSGVEHAVQVVAGQSDKFAAQGRTAGTASTRRFPLRRKRQRECWRGRCRAAAGRRGYHEQIAGMVSEPLLANRLASCLEDLAAEQPLVIAIDDLQWADRVSRFLLRSPVSRLAGLPVV
jgi:hypothetical protein